MDTSHDVVILGGGPSGATAAILLAQAGWKVAIVEKAQFPRRKVCGEFISGTTWPLLRKLGVADPLMEIAGPIVRRVGVYSGDAMVTAQLVAPTDKAEDGGRAIGREHLDTQLLKRAAEVGADVWQPFALASFVENGNGYICNIINKCSREERALSSRLLIAAHGSCESGAMPTQNFRRPQRTSDLFGFKAHFLNSTLPSDLMPLLAFPGGYGGMVHSDGDRVSLSCCIRRDQLEKCRQHYPKVSAGTAVFAHIKSSCKGVSEALSLACVDGAWLSSGPLHTGVHTFGRDGIFTVGNATAEIHPIVAEGISMAIQSAFLLSEQLNAWRARINPTFSNQVLESLRHNYEVAWRNNFSRRIRVATLFAHLFMRPLTSRIVTGGLERFPRLLTEGARWSGKAEPLLSF
ncbi:NAD(P)/FAD-dependent oxidoreductase [Ferrovum myxofaciens]|jgi:flavin-dependent dehydrogenase|uniref:NAD(P)/FAD-dependent oxidoreductase n=1 Tax=Ferrovum myxofaciens TaxID=416213 RepID=UPI0004E10655|nr:NAD(P)/FAD-dependent oxidoreductase [Ferrovum myxofaciens]